jgi:chromosome segregation protein
MKLTALKLHGFKSFADRTELRFHDGITAVVGPNGCGKSNVSDAIRWVLGEQRPGAIRGARMEEAIFQGTIHRRPVNRGSVSLEVSNAHGILPVPFSEVEITRTVYRDGGSEYALNRSTCRLRDIQDLVRDTGLGANAYAIIENRMIDAILSDRAEERRALFEEAAGIGRYKDRRKAAARRLEQGEVDLQRLDDLISEVESKVRSLARQKGKAERWKELRKRRLDAEVSLARIQLEALQGRAADVTAALTTESATEVTKASGVHAAEARLETLRMERATLERSRSKVGASLSAVAQEIAAVERELAISAERMEAAERRLGRIHGEREEARTRLAGAGTERESLEAQGVEIQVALEALSAEAASARARSDEIRGRLEVLRHALGTAEAREREVARRIAQLGGDREGAEAQAEELANRVRIILEERAEAQRELTEMDQQGDLFTDRMSGLAARIEGSKGEVEKARAGIETLRTTLEATRRTEIEAQEARATLGGRVKALERLEADQEGMDPVVKALLRAGLPGVEGVLADALEVPAGLAEAVERFLGPMARAVVVRDRAATEQVLTWFREGWGKGGGLLLLPLDRLAQAAADGGAGADDTADNAPLLLDLVQLKGPGGGWVQVLLRGVRVVSESGVLDGGAGSRVSQTARAQTALSVDERGVLRIGNPMGATGLLERREQLRQLVREAKGAEVRVQEAQQAREAAQGALREAEEALEHARRLLREAEDAHREARAEETARSHRRARIVRTLEDLDRQGELARTGEVRARERAEVARVEQAGLAGEEATLSEARARARSEVDAVQEGWEAAQAEASRVSLEEARRQAERDRVRDRLQALERDTELATRRLAALDQEEAELRAEVDQATEVRRSGTQRLQEAFGRREGLQAERSRWEEQWVALEQTTTEAERGLREARETERAASDRRHALELEAGELQGKIGRIQERLEGEWSRPLTVLLEEADPLEGTEAELRSIAKEVHDSLERLGPVNQLAVEEHEEERTRLDFLTAQREDLILARNDLRSAIREINLTATRLFQETFEQIRENFRATFLRLFQGGECDLRLEDPEDPLDSLIEIQASPRGKRTQRIDLLSGGERALTALSLLFGIYLVKPSPFCVLDEVDAPLDESNIGRFIHLLQEFKAQTQFVVITHNPRTIEAADWIYGVTMEEPGVSRIVGVRLEEALKVASAV